MKQGTHAVPNSAATSLCVHAVRCVPSLRAVAARQPKHSSHSRHRASPLVVAIAPSDDHDQPAQHMPEWLAHLMQPPAAVPALSLSLIPAAWIGSGSGGWFGGHGNSGNGGNGGDGPDGGSGGNQGSQAIADLAAESDDDDEYEDDEEDEESEEEDEGDDDEEGPVPAARDSAATLDNGSRFYCAEIVATGLPTGKGAPTEVCVLMGSYICAVLPRYRCTSSSHQEDLFAGLKCQPGFDCTREEVSEDLRTLFQCVW